MGKATPLTINSPVTYLQASSNVEGLLSLLNVKKLSLWYSTDSPIIFGKGAIKKMNITHNGFQLSHRAHESNINKNPVARKADKNMILFNGFILALESAYIMMANYIYIVVWCQPCSKSFLEGVVKNCQ